MNRRDLFKRSVAAFAAAYFLPAEQITVEAVTPAAAPAAERYRAGSNQCQLIEMRVDGVVGEFELVTRCGETTVRSLSSPADQILGVVIDNSRRARNGQTIALVQLGNIAPVFTRN